MPQNKDIPTFRALRFHMIYELKEEEGGWQIILNNGNTSLRGTVSVTPIGSKITLESAKTNRLQLCLLHSSSAQLNTHCHLRLPSVLTDSWKREADKKEQRLWYPAMTECALDHLCHLCIIKSLTSLSWSVTLRFSLPLSFWERVIAECTLMMWCLCAGVLFNLWLIQGIM